ncbi:mannonate dehydratase [Isoptericola aurantiacus]|uniref:mannonate dehydratase n=1 Tax=Isoptericola aurantiacus TaxID=3377839 RepID=UPI00383AB625
MEHTWRWFGPKDPITLADVRQTGATGVVTALHEVPNGAVWTVEAITERREAIEAAGLTWSVVESIPVHDDVKRRAPGYERWLESWAQSVRNLAACGIDVVCYNFMPVLDWVRTDLAYPMPDGALALRFDQDAFAAFDLFLLQRPGAEADYTAAETERAHRHLESMTPPEVDRLVATLAAGLPGSEEVWTLDALRAELEAYAAVDDAALRSALVEFLEAVVPVAAECGVRLGIHPDDPPRPVLGLPRIMSTAADARWLLDAVPQEASGLTFCTGSFGVRADNDLVAMVEEFAPRIHFAHLRSTRREGDGRSFHEAPHLDGDVDMVGVIEALAREERRRADHGGARIPMRPDHGHLLLAEQTSERAAAVPGYSLVGRLKGLAELRGVERAVHRQLG